MSNINEPENRPKERIEHLISKRGVKNDQRIHERIPVETGAVVYFPLICKGEVTDVSEEGISVRFKPSEIPGLELDKILQLTMPLETCS